MPQAARSGDPHTCPAHGAGPITGPGAPSVLIADFPAARVSDAPACGSTSDSIAMGSTSVLIESKSAARVGDSTAHGGVIVSGEASVLIGD